MAARNNLESAQQLLVAASLAQLDARPPIISAICGLSKFVGLQLYKELYGESPRTGMLPYDPFWILRSSLNCIHASIFYGIYTDIKDKAPAFSLDSQIFLSAYRIYKDIASSGSIIKRKNKIIEAPRLDINRAWHITRQVKNGEAIMAICAKCQSRHLVVANFPEPYRQCPVCDVWSDKTGRNRWMTVPVKYRSNK